MQKKQQQFNTPIRRDVAPPAPAAAAKGKGVSMKANVDLDEGERDGVSCDDDEDGFVLVRATKGVVPVVGEIVSSTVYTAASAAKGAVAAAAVTAAMNYGTSAVVSYTFETVGVTAIARGAYVSLRSARLARVQAVPSQRPQSRMQLRRSLRMRARVCCATTVFLVQWCARCGCVAGASVKQFHILCVVVGRTQEPLNATHTHTHACAHTRAHTRAHTVLHIVY
jgi:hypothetical protein